MCMERDILFLESTQYIYLKYVARKRKNNHVEFYALWLILKTITNRGLKYLQVFGDLNMLMDWANNICQIENILVSSIMNQV
jgi:hypothetical protein